MRRNEVMVIVVGELLLSTVVLLELVQTLKSLWLLTVVLAGLMGFVCVLGEGW